MGSHRTRVNTGEVGPRPRRRRVGPIRYTPDGTIIDGLCEQRLAKRREREEGAKQAWDALQKQAGCIRKTHGWLRIVKPLKITMKEVYELPGSVEIGWRRFMQIVAEPLLRKGMSFRLKWMRRWINDVAAFEWGGSGLKAVKPNDDALYKKRRREEADDEI